MVRQGDSLRLAVLPTEPVGGGVKAEIEVVGVTNYLIKVKEPVAHRFYQTGSFIIRATYQDQNQKSISRSIIVKVGAAAFNGQPACWMNRTRFWDCPDLPPEAVIQNDPRLKLAPVSSLADHGLRLSLTVDAAEPRWIVARLGHNGPVMANTKADGFAFYSGAEDFATVVETYPDGSKIIEQWLVLYPVLPDLIVRLNIFTGGILFDDGATVKELTPADFDELGQARVRFIKPPEAQTSVCHRTRLFQGPVDLGYY
jgi:hypothetical protein